MSPLQFPLFRSAILCFGLLVFSSKGQSQDSLGPEAEIIRGALSRYADGFGGRFEMSKLQSLRFEGTYRFRDRQWPLVLVKRPDQKARLTVIQNEGNLVRLHTEKGGFERLPFENDFSILDGVQRSNFERLSYFFSPFWAIGESPDGEIRYSGKVEFQGRPVLIFEFQREPLGHCSVWFDESNSVVVRIEQVLLDSGSELIADYSDFRQVDSFTIPFQIEVRLDGTLFESYTFDRIQPNVGIFPSVFDIDE